MTEKKYRYNMCVFYNIISEKKSPGTTLLQTEDQRYSGGHSSYFTVWGFQKGNMERIIGILQSNCSHLNFKVMRTVGFSDAKIAYVITTN